MVQLREIPRTAVFAWSPGAGRPLLVTGTRAGAVDADFSDETKLELWDLNLDGQNQGIELQPIVSISADSRFYDIAWSPPDSDHPRGIIAGALENGSLDLWDAEKLASGVTGAFLSRTTKHSGAIKSLQFNPLKPQILATAGAKGELFIYNIDDIQNPFRLGTAAARSDDLECLAWNRKVANILATGGAGGLVTVWDLKTRKASLTLNNNRKPVSAISWDPNNSTKLLTASPDDSTPLIFLWNLRNSNAPERTLHGHEQGVLSLSWCQQDPALLLSCGKDNRTLIWNPQTGERYGEFPEVTNWTFLTRFNPHHPNLSATASFDGKITVQTLQTTNSSTAQAAAQSSLNDEDFFTKAHSQPQGASFSLSKAPLWLQRPVGASFGFGGKLVVLSEVDSSAGQQRSSKIEISHFSVDADLGASSQQFEAALAAGDLESIGEKRLEDAKTEEETADWKVIQTMIAANSRQRVVEFLGFSKEKTQDVQTPTPDETQNEGSESSKSQDNGIHPNPKEHRISNIFADGEGDDVFLSDLAATKKVKDDSPFHLLKEGNTSLEDQVTRALMLGDFSRAADICLKEDRIADAFIIANCGGKELVDRIQAAYLSQKGGSPSYLRLLSSVIAGDLWDVIHNANLADWKEVMATLCTFADPSEFPDLCEALGDRMLDTGSRKDASFCYLVGSKLEKVVYIWIGELEEAEEAGLAASKENSTFAVHAKLLQHFIEKVTVFRRVTKFEDVEKRSDNSWKLAALYDKYAEYADIIAAHGQLGIAERYLDLLPTAYPAAEVARDRVHRATRKTAPNSTKQPGRHTVPNPHSTLPIQPATANYHPPQQGLGAGSLNSYPAPSQVPVANPYAPPQPSHFGATAAPYGQPTPGYSPPQQTGYGSSFGYGQPASSSFGPPPGKLTTSTAAPPRAKDVGSWNDVPVVTKAPPPRRSTPSVAPIPSPFGAQHGVSAAVPPPAAYGQLRSAPTPPPPPPKGPAPPRVTSPLAGPPLASQPPARPTSAATTAYAPPAPPTAASPPVGAQVMPLRTSSPYNPPPSGPAPSRYTPIPSPQASTDSTQPQAGNGLPPTGNRPSPLNPYAPMPQQQGGIAHPPSAMGSAPPRAGVPVAGPPPMSKLTAPPPPPPPHAAALSKAKHPSGDRSHIPASARNLVEILSNDMQRVSAKAPAAYQSQVNDTRKRLNLLFDHLNNEELVTSGTIQQLDSLAEALASKAFDVAQKLQMDIHRDKPEECGHWMVGIKRLISMSKATP